MLEISSTDPPYGGLAVLGGRNSSVSGPGRARVESALGVVVAVVSLALALAQSVSRSGGQAVDGVGVWVGCVVD